MGDDAKKKKAKAGKEKNIPAVKSETKLKGKLKVAKDKPKPKTKPKPKPISAKIAFLISGRGSNMEAILEKIEEGKLRARPMIVFSDSASAPGLEIAKANGIPTETFSPADFVSSRAYEERLVELLKQYNVDWIVCAGYMRILRETMVSAFPNRIINIHPALLPAFPGLNAQKQALLYGVKHSGCTVHLVDIQTDNGPILMQKVVPVKNKDTVDSLSKRILKAEHSLYWRALKRIFAGYKLDGRRMFFDKK